MTNARSGALHDTVPGTAGISGGGRSSSLPAIPPVVPVRQMHSRQHHPARPGATIALVGTDSATSSFLKFSTVFI